MITSRIGSKVESSCSNGSCRANLLRVREAAGLCLTEATHPPGLRVPPHSHEKTHFCLLLQGVYEENWGRDIFVRKLGTPVVRSTPIASTAQGYGSSPSR